MRRSATATAGLQVPVRLRQLRPKLPLGSNLLMNWTPDLLRWRADYEQQESLTKDSIMGRYASDSGNKEFQQLTPGTHLARCYSIVDLGVQRGEYQGTPTVRKQIVVRWEVPGETIEIDGEAKPLTISRFYTNSLNEKSTLRHDLVAWRGREFTAEELMRFDLQNILGKPCLITVAHNDKGKARVLAVSGLAKGMQCPAQYNPSEVFWLDEWDQAKFDLLPEGFQKIIRESDEYKERMAPQAHGKSAPAVDPEDDGILPF
jgi:hypothetical protein